MNQLRFRPVQHLKMTLWISVLWKIFLYLVKKWPEMAKNGNWGGRLEVVTIDDNPCIFYHWVYFYSWIDFTCCHYKKKKYFSEFSFMFLSPNLLCTIEMNCKILAFSLKFQSLNRRSEQFWKQNTIYQHCHLFLASVYQENIYWSKWKQKL